MPRLFDVLPVDRDVVARAVERAWALTLGDEIKASQNTTYAASLSSAGPRVAAVRVTPDPEGVRHARIEDEMTFVAFLAQPEWGTGICKPLASSSTSSSAEKADSSMPPSSFAVREGQFTICAVSWATGAPIDFLSFRWATDADVIRAWGACTARMHVAARAFVRARPDVAARIRPWTALHDGVMAGAVATLDARDVVVMRGGLGDEYGLLHGDFNVSNFHLVEEERASSVGTGGDSGGGGGGVEGATAAATVPAAAASGSSSSSSSGSSSSSSSSSGSSSSSVSLSLSVFDTDQVQQGWWEYDLAQSAIASLMLHEAGSIPAGDPVPQAQPAFFLDRLVEGYEAVAGAPRVDRARLARMLALRKDFYRRFCTRAQAEGDVPPAMAWFVAYVMERWFAGNNDDAAAAAAAAGGAAAGETEAAGRVKREEEELQQQAGQQGEEATALGATTGTGASGN
jgi:hypothetical protein